jgi:hypothetical protein
MQRALQDNASAGDIDTRKLFLTIFKDETGCEKFMGEYTLPEWRDRISSTNAGTKENLFWLKGAKFGDTKSKNKSYRTNLNLDVLTAVVVEYDAGEIGFSAAVDIIDKAGVRALLYTSPSHRNDKPKWRIILPLSYRAAKTRHEALVAMVNGLFDGKLAPESFTLSQSYYFGSDNRNSDHRAVVVDGQFLDLKVDALHRNSIFKDGSRLTDNPVQRIGSQRHYAADHEPVDDNPFTAFRNGAPADESEIEFALNQISPDCPYREKDAGNPTSWMHVGAAIASAVEHDAGLAMFQTWSAKSVVPGKYSEANCKEKFKDFSEMTSIGIATLFKFATLANPNWEDEWHALGKPDTVDDVSSKPKPQSPFRFLSSAVFVKNFVPPDYLLDGVLLRGYVYAFTANTGHGKTAVCLALTEAIARGVDFAGREVTKGRVLYFAGENPDDVRLRWIAMAEQHKFDVDAIEVNFIPGTFDIDKFEKLIRAKVDEVGGVILVIIDTSPAYFHGDDENANVAMIQHAQMLYKLRTLPGKPTVLAACHPVKNAGKDNLIPRGGGGFLNALDGNLTAWRDETTVTVHHAGKFRGPDFEPITFELIGATAERLIDSKGRQIPTVIAKALSKDETKEKTAQIRDDEDDILILLLGRKEPTSLDDIADALHWYMTTNTPNRMKVSRAIKKLGVKVVTVDRDGALLTKPVGVKKAEKADYNRKATGATYG